MRQEHDQQLRVRHWRVTPIQEEPVVQETGPAPWWWTGDEDATEQNLRAMGMTL